MEPFYGKEIDAAAEQKLIEKMLIKHRAKPATEALKKEIYDELMEAKHAGKISIPFKLALRKDPSGVHREYVEVILDTKV